MKGSTSIAAVDRDRGVHERSVYEWVRQQKEFEAYSASFVACTVGRVCFEFLRACDFAIGAGWHIADHMRAELVTMAFS